MASAQNRQAQRSTARKPLRLVFADDDEAFRRLLQHAETRTTREVFAEASTAASWSVVSVPMGFCDGLASARCGALSDLLGFDEVVISMPPARESRWLHLDLPRKGRALGVPVSQVINAALGAGESSVHE